jgi:hypothetical protein
LSVETTPSGLIGRLRGAFEEHQLFATLLLLFITFRAAAILLLKPGGFMLEGAPDQFYYLLIARITAGERYPFLHYWMEYPPPFPWMTVAAYKLSLLIPAHKPQELWFNTLLRLPMLLFDAGNLVLLYVLALRLHDRENAFRAALTYTLLFVPLLTLLGWYDNIVLFFMLLAVYGMVRGRPVLSGAGIGLGFGFKMLPLVVAPAAVQVFREKKGPPTFGLTGRRVLLVGVTALVMIGLAFGPFLAVQPAYTLAFFQTLGARNGWQTVWALLDGYRGWGYVAQPKDRIDPASALEPSGIPTHLPWGLITLAFGALGLWLWTRPINWDEPRRSVAFAGLTFNLLILYSKGYSVQWGLYLVAWAILLIPGLRGTLWGLFMSALTLAEWPVAIGVFPDYPGLWAGVIIVRTVATVALCLEYAGGVFPAVGWLEVARRWALPVVGIGAVLAGLIGLPFVARTYGLQRLRAEPAADFIRSLDGQAPPGAAIITTQPEVYERLSGYLHDDLALWMLPNVEQTPWVEPETWLADTMAGYERVWFVEDRLDPLYYDLNDRVLYILNQRACPVGATWYAETHTAAFLTARPKVDRPVTASFEDGIRLTGFGVPSNPVVPGAAWCVVLEWEADATPSTAYIVFVHLRDADGAVRAQNDQGPSGGTRPTFTWTPGETVEDAHGIILPADLPPGEYTLHVGLYRADNGERLPVVGGEGTQPDDSLLLTSLIVEAPSP